jgi:hypothetical protein
MTFEEKIDKLKHKFSEQDFKDPFIHGIEILKSIERKFIIAKDIRHDLNNLRPDYAKWSENIKNKIEIISIATKDLNQWLIKLDSNSNFWIVLTPGSVTSGKNLVFDCKPNALVDLYYMTQMSFFLVDKKYGWLLFFELGKMKTTTIYKSGTVPTPFEGG